MFDNKNATPNDDDWARKTLETVALAGIQEQKRSRRWRIFFSILILLYLTVIAVGVFGKASKVSHYDVMGNRINPANEAHIALVRLEGVIASDEDANAEQLSALITRVASQDNVKGLLIVANSPGGSPVQSSLVYQTIQSVKATYQKPIMTVVTDVCASGCYYIVSASDEIYADQSSIVGSIGVISSSFGYEEAAKKLGIQPRTYTAGKNKDFLNPAREPTPEEIAFLHKLLDDLHQNFIEAVKVGRGDKLSKHPDLFSGLFWTGDEAQALGLIDGIATPQMVAKKIGNYPVLDYQEQSLPEQLLKRFGAEAQGVVNGGVKQMFNKKIELEMR